MVLNSSIFNRSLNTWLTVFSFLCISFSIRASTFLTVTYQDNLTQPTGIGTVGNCLYLFYGNNLDIRLLAQNAPRIYSGSTTSSQATTGAGNLLGGTLVSSSVSGVTYNQSGSLYTWTIPYTVFSNQTITAIATLGAPDYSEGLNSFPYNLAVYTPTIPFVTSNTTPNGFTIGVNQNYTNESDDFPAPYVPISDVANPDASVIYTGLSNPFNASLAFVIGATAISMIIIWIKRALFPGRDNVSPHVGHARHLASRYGKK